MKARMISRATMTALTILMLVVSAAPTLASAANDRSLQQAEPFAWWMEPRYEQGWMRYDPDTHSYPSDYLYPTGWQVGFDACESQLSAGREVVSYRWHVEGVNHVYSFDTEPVSACRLDSASSPAAPALPVQGFYIVTLTLAFADGGEEIGSLQIEVKDLLIVSVGDSNASGEGNPHVNQAGGLRPADDIWFDRRCHRSANSGHARAAAKIEADDPHTAVTFLSFACSGAEIWSGLIANYNGIEPGGAAEPLKPQLLAVMEHLCLSSASPGCVENPRQIDSMFVSIGVNDLSFATILMSCAAKQTIDEMLVEDLFIPGIIDGLAEGDWETIMYYTVDLLLAPIDHIVTVLNWAFGLFDKEFLVCEEELDPLMEMNLAALWAHFNLLGEVLDGDAGQVAAELQSEPVSHYWMTPSLRTRFGDLYGSLPAEMVASVTPRNVYITSYPADPFQDEFGNHDGCGFFERIDGSEATWIAEQGAKLNQRIEWAATANRWHYVGGIVEGFQGHGYCAGDQGYFVRLTDSLLTQYNYQGAMHPNYDGHTVTRDRLLDVYYAEKPDWTPKYGVSVKLEAARISDSRENPQSQATFTAKIYDEWYRHEHMIDQIEMPVGEWFNLPEDRFHYYAALASDESITILAHTSVGGGLFYPPKCHTPECAQVIEPTRLRTERDYSLANSWGGDYGWCEDEPLTTFFKQERSCTVALTDGSFALEVRFRITVVHLALAPSAPIEEMEVCADHCVAAASGVYGSLAEYLERLAAAGEETDLIATLLNYMEEQVAVAVP